MNGPSDLPMVATAQITGRRDAQEDRVAVHATSGVAAVHGGELLLLLADGMGGHVGGEVASRLVVEHFCQHYLSSHAGVTSALRSSLNSANERLAETVAETPRLRGMGATLVGCVIRGNELFWVSVGDSPLWLFREGSLRRLNADHSMRSLLDDMVSSGEMSHEAAQADLRRHMLRSAVAGKSIELVDLCAEPWRLHENDVVVLASDGVETLDVDELASMLGQRQGRTLQQLAGDIMARIEAVARPGQDNASIILFCRDGKG